MLATFVEDLLAQFGGGETYFDALDNFLREPVFFEALTDLVYNDHGYLPHIVVTGRFGEAYRDWFNENHTKYLGGRGDVLVLPGGLRRNPRLASRALLGRRLEHSYVFLDDSFYLGRSADAVGNAVKERGSWVSSIYVLYDGSPASHDRRVISLYNYRLEQQQKAAAEWKNAILRGWDLYGAIYITRDAFGNAVVHNPADLTITVNPTRT